MAILLMVINSYCIGGYSINDYWCLLMAIGGYSVISHWWLFYWWLLMVI
jgi:hypothetical protein